MIPACRGSSTAAAAARCPRPATTPASPRCSSIAAASRALACSAPRANPTPRTAASVTKDALLTEMDAAGVDAAVIHPPTSWDPNANELAIEAARQHPDRLAILGNFPRDKPESRALIDGWKKRPGMLGLRFTFLQPHRSEEHTSELQSQSNLVCRLL